MGKFSRAKGYREERGLVKFLEKLGHTNVTRVPLSGAMRAYPYDVKSDYEGKSWTYEMKSRATLFSWVYFRVLGKTTYRLRWADDFKREISIAPTPQEAVKTGFDYTFERILEEDKTRYKYFKRLVTLGKLRQGADFLVLKNNNLPRLFIHYWGCDESPLPKA